MYFNIRKYFFDPDFKLLELHKSNMLDAYEKI